MALKQKQPNLNSSELRLQSSQETQMAGSAKADSSQAGGQSYHLQETSIEPFITPRILLLLWPLVVHQILKNSS